MNGRERLKTIFSGKAADRCGFWLGCPHADTWPIYLKHFNQPTPDALRAFLQDDYAWICPEWGSYKHPEGKSIWQISKHSFGEAGPLAACETVQHVDAFDWPNPDYLDFTDCLAALRGAGDLYRASGMWCSFYHAVMDLFSMEQYFIKMYTHPEVVEAATRHVCEFYLEANERFFRQAVSLVDGFFFGNDFGTQLDLMISPEMFDRFVMPWFRKFTDQGHSHGYQVVLHSCGAIHKVIGRLVDAGVDALHPLQARAADMDAASLARDFKGKIAFLGGIDTQHLLVHGIPADIKADVRRVKDLLGPCLVVSPSHEALLPNVPPENVLAMAEAAREPSRL
ncbi:MAG TPA: uroporphyrinogen decarboxylase family protein [Planctomycetota bacterium]|nr:uroporphyrinogen decarboxylase family protein [Planctomycetota bacterium]